jgi:hypothetical protein
MHADISESILSGNLHAVSQVEAEGCGSAKIGLLAQAHPSTAFRKSGGTPLRMLTLFHFTMNLEINNE